MKIIAGTNRKKKEKETSEEPKPKANTLKIPKSVTDDPQKHRLNHSVRAIANGYIQNTSYEHPDHGYVSHEFYHQTNPLEESNG